MRTVYKPRNVRQGGKCPHAYCAGACRWCVADLNTGPSSVLCYMGMLCLCVSLTTRLPIIATPMGPSPNSTSGSSTGVTPTCMYTHTHITHGGSNGIALCDLEHALWHALCVLCVCYMCVCVWSPDSLTLQDMFPLHSYVLCAMVRIRSAAADSCSCEPRCGPLPLDAVIP